METEKQKICCKCKTSKDLNEFNKCKNRKDGLQTTCRICSIKNNKTHYSNNKEKVLSNCKDYRDKNKDKIKASHKAYRENNKDEIKFANKIYRDNNKDKVKAWRNNNKAKIKIYIDTNRSKINTRRKKYLKNPHNKIACVCRSRVILALRRYKGVKKSVKTIELIGCSIEKLKLYLEAKFTQGMTWDNHTLEGWHIDHIVPCSSFDLTNVDEQKLCFHYTNLQPLWATTQIAMSYGEGPDYIGNKEKGGNRPDITRSR